MNMYKNSIDFLTYFFKEERIPFIILQKILAIDGHNILSFQIHLKIRILLLYIKLIVVGKLIKTYFYVYQR